MAEEERADYYQPPTLGDLTRALARERGELRQFDTEGRYIPPGQPGGDVTADLQRATGLVRDTEGKAINPRPPPLLYEVISTFDSRPVQAYDFQHSECIFMNWSGTPPTWGSVFAEYIVPANTVAILKKFRYQLISPPVNHVVEGDCWLQSDLLVNELPVREYNQMLHPVTMQLFFDSFLIVDELKRLRLKLSVFDPNNTEFSQVLNGEQTPVLVEMWGVLIVKTGVPIEFEVANPRGGQFS